MRALLDVNVLLALLDGGHIHHALAMAWLEDHIQPDWSRILGRRQVTDAYLLALAVHHGGRLVSFDRRIAPGAVTGATADHLVVLG